MQARMHAYRQTQTEASSTLTWMPQGQPSLPPQCGKSPRLAPWQFKQWSEPHSFLRQGLFLNRPWPTSSEGLLNGEHPKLEEKLQLQVVLEARRSSGVIGSEAAHLPGSENSGAASVLVVAHNHLAVEFLLLFLECVLHFFPLQASVPEKQKPRRKIATPSLTWLNTPGT